MSANSSSFSSLLEQLLSSSSSYLTMDQYCFISRPSSFIFITFYITNIFILFPLIVIILHTAVKELQQKRSVISASTFSNFECFTYNSVVMEIFGTLRCIPYCFGIYIESLTLILVGGYLSSFIWYGESFFNFLTCVERYLAVVHPVIYRSLRNTRGIRIRNISISGVWLACFIRMGLFTQKDMFFIDLCLLILLLSLIAFCSLSVLCVLIRPGPGRLGSGRADQSKQRAFYTIVAILGVLICRFMGSLIWNILVFLEVNNECLIMAVIVWFNLPTSLVLPLLYLQKKGRVLNCKKTF